MSCKNGNPLCEDMTDNEHRCPKRRGVYGYVGSMSDEMRLQHVMRALAIADAQGHASLTLQRHDVRVLCEALRIASAADGTAILYALDNPTLSRDVAERRAGAPACAWCGHARTPSNAHLHAECDAILESGRAS